MSSQKTIEFRASIAPIMSGIRTGGDGLRLTLDIPESDVKDAVALIALRNCPLLVTIAVDGSPASTRIERPSENGKPKSKSKKEAKGPYSEFWRQMVLRGVKNNLDLQDFLNCSIENVWDALHERFEVDTMATVSPIEWDEFVSKNHLNPGLIDISRNAALEASINMAKQQAGNKN